MPDEQSSDDGPRKLSDAWIFVSHSHRDLEAVRRVRDEFEQLRANPLLFFLMCLNENEELDSLIKREITARNFFLLCDSPFARNSPWVQKERAFVQSLKDRKIHELDLDWPWEQQKRVIRETLRSATTFLNYAARDRERVRPYVQILTKNDFAIFEFRLMSGGRWVDQLNDDAIQDSLNGYFITILSNAWLQSEFAVKEFGHYLELTKSMKIWRPPIVAAIDPVATLLARLPLDVQMLQILDFSRGDTADHEQQLLKAVELREPDSG